MKQMDQRIHPERIHRERMERIKRMYSKKGEVS